MAFVISTKAPALPGKLVLRPEASVSDLCEVDGSEVAAAGFPRTPQLPPSSSKAFHAVNTFFFLAASQWKAKKLETFSGRRPVS